MKEETGGWLTATPEQIPTTRKQEETNIDPQLNHILPTEHELEVSAHQVSGMEIIITAHRLITLELKTTLPFPRGWSRKDQRVHILAHAKRDAESNGTRRGQCSK